MGFLFRWLMMGFHQVSWRKWLILYVDFTRKTKSLCKSSIRGMKQDQWLIIPILICIKHRRLIGGILYNSARSVDVAQLGVNHVKLFCLNVCMCVFLLLLCFLVLLFCVQCTWSNCRHIMLDYSNEVMKLGSLFSDWCRSHSAGRKPHEGNWLVVPAVYLLCHY